MKRSVVILISLLIILSVLTGCSKSATKVTTESQTKSNTSSEAKSNTAGKLIEPFELISKSEAEQLIGEPLQDPKNTETKAVGQKISFYEAVKEDPNNYSRKFLQVTLQQEAFMPDNGQSPKSIYGTIKSAFPTNDKVDGVGDEAFIAPPGLHILKGSNYITIGVGNSNDAKNREILKAAGKKAVENLEKLTGK